MVGDKEREGWRTDAEKESLEELENIKRETLRRKF